MPLSDTVFQRTFYREDAQYSEATLVLLGHGQTSLGQPHGTLAKENYKSEIVGTYNELQNRILVCLMTITS